MCRKACKECPWTKNNNHSKSWTGYVKSMTNLGKIENDTHACHMITSDVWGYKNEIGKDNVCIGSLKNDNK